MCDKENIQLVEQGRKIKQLLDEYDAAAEPLVASVEPVLGRREARKAVAALAISVYEATSQKLREQGGISD